METASTLFNRLLSRGKFRHIQVLLKLAELGSIQRTGEAIGMTQSGVTQTLAYIERLADTPLFHRHARGVSPTAACAALLPSARNLMQGMLDCAEALHTQKQGSVSSVRLMASAAAVNGLLLHALPDFHTQVPGIQVQLREAEGQDLSLAMARKEIDLLVCRRPDTLPQGWQFHPLFSDRLVVVAGAAHPLAQEAQIDWMDLANERWITAPNGSLARTGLDDIATRLGLQWKTYPLVTRSLVVLHSLLAKEPLIALLPRSFIEPQLEDGSLIALNLNTELPLDPLGVLISGLDATEAALRLSQFLIEGQKNFPVS